MLHARAKRQHQCLVSNIPTDPTETHEPPDRAIPKEELATGNDDLDSKQKR